MTKKVGVLTGGGDCPGLNAVIRAATRRSLDRGHQEAGDDGHDRRQATRGYGGGGGMSGGSH